MGRSNATISKRLRNTALIIMVAIWQAAFPLGPIIASEIAAAAPVCTVDTAGANDEPGQKDLTQLCVDYSGVPATIGTTWNWDELGTSGANTLDTCNLFDTDGDGFINYAVCVTTSGKPATLQLTATYKCGNDKIDRCTTPHSLLPNGATLCNVSQQSTDPFPSGDEYPNDTEGVCTIDLSTVGGSAAKLIDVCSYPSGQSNSDPSDCVIAQPKAGKLEVRKVLVPATDPGLFNLRVDGTTQAANVGNNGTTGELVYPEGTHTVGETAGTNTSLAGYSSSISCRDLNGSGNVVASGSGTSLQLALADQADVVCVITNTASGSITISKDAQPNAAQDFHFTATGTGVNSFDLDDDSDPTLPNSKSFNNLAGGTYSFTESAVSGWDLSGIICSNGANVSVNGATVTINLTAGQNITCGYTNVQRGHLIVEKTTVPANDPTIFSINASGTGTIIGSSAGTISDSTDKDYEVTPGTYSVSETAVSGWAKTGDTCQNVAVAPGATVRCQLTNTKLAKLRIIKDAVPNGPQDFSFSTTGAGLTAFLLDDDSDPTLPNSQQFSNLMPGNYSVSEAAVLGWDLTNLSCTNGGNRSGSTLNITLSAGADVTCTFTNTQRGSISGTKNQVNNDGSFVSTLSGWTINLLQNGQVIDSTVTGADGSFSFTNLINGTYSLMEALQDGWTQIYSPSAVDLQAGQTSTGNNFGNFQNGSIGGYKFNDVDGDGVKDSDEPKLSGWTITLYNDNNDADNLLNNIVASAQTDGSGNYNFTNLTPGSYQVCETNQAGWVQTLPGNNGCYTFVIDQSGETNQAVFGNQGQGSIRVIKNVDTNGDGQIDQSNVTDWTWNINGSGNYATGSGNAQTVAAGTYTVSENQKTGYHVTASECSGEAASAQPSTSLGVTISPGEQVTCTFTNTRDTGTLTLIKHVINDNGGTAAANDFTLHVTQAGTDVSGSPAAGSESGTPYTLITGTYTVSEDTPPSGYEQISTVCNGEPATHITVTKDTNRVCIITNDDIAPKLTVIKHVINDNSGVATAKDFTMQVTGTDVMPGSTFPGSENGTTVTLDAGNYTVSEGVHDGYTVSYGNNCQGSIGIGETKTCTVTNNDIAHPAIHVVKSGPAMAHEGDNVTYTFTVTNTGDTTLSGTAVTDSLTGIGIYQSGDTNNDGILQKTETWVFTGNYTIPTDQLADVLNTVTACATDPDHTKVCDTDDHRLDVLHPTISVVKNGPLYGYEGQVIGYTFVVTNTGDTILSNVGIDDNIANLETCEDSTLAPTESTNCTASFLIPTPQIADVTNVVIASGTDPLGRTVHSSDDHTLDVLHPSIHVDKTGPANAYEGDGVTYTFTVTNTGDIPLSNLTVNDSVTGVATYQSGDTNNDTILDLNETWIYTATYTVPSPQEKDVANTVTACGLDVLETQACDTDDHSLHIFHPMITVNKVVISSDNEDPGLFNLQIDGQTAGSGTNVGDGGTTGAVKVTPGLHTIGETAGSGTFLGGYDATFSENCADGQVTVSGDESVVCTIINTKQDVTLTISKSVDRPAPLPNLTGDILTYTLVVQVPEDSGASYDTVVTDLPPENFTYIHGSWTAVLTTAEHTTVDLKASNVTTEPTYGSPGKWNLGTLRSGDFVTLTYRAIIGSTVSPGTYPDLAFATGFDAPSNFNRQTVTAGCVDSCADTLGTPFVSTAAAIVLPAPSTIFAGQVLGTSILVNTGQSLTFLQFVIPTALILVTGLLWNRPGQRKGASL